MGLVQNIRLVGQKVVTNLKGADASIELPIMTSWQAHTPTWNANMSTVSTNEGYWRRIGDTMDIAIIAIASGNGSGGAVFTTIPIGLNVDVDKIPVGGSPTSVNAGQLGMGVFAESGVAFKAMGVYMNDTVSQITFAIATGDTTGGLTGTSISSGDRLNFTLSVPILEWG